MRILSMFMLYKAYLLDFFSCYNHYSPHRPASLSALFCQASMSTALAFTKLTRRQKRKAARGSERPKHIQKLIKFTTSGTARCWTSALWRPLRRL